MIDLSRYRLIDLSHELVPGERKQDGSYLHGEPFYGRSVEVQEFHAYNARMHFIQSQTHNGTHVEAPYKYDESGDDIADMPLESYIGEAIVCDLDYRAGEEVTVNDLMGFGVKSNDIVLLRSSLKENQPYLGFEAVDWLINTKIKAFGSENVHHSPPGTEFGLHDSDGRLLLAGIPYLDALAGLQQITKPRVFFIGLPVKIKRVTASWIRAVVLEEID